MWLVKPQFTARCQIPETESGLSGTPNHCKVPRFLGQKHRRNDSPKPALLIVLADMMGKEEVREEGNSEKEGNSKEEGGKE